MKALMDADMLHYQAAFSAQFTPKPTEKEKELGITHEEIILPFEQAAAILDNLIADINDQVGATEHVLFLTGKDNFREKIAKKAVYKENRSDKEKPFHYENLKAYLIHSLGAVVIDGMEADDAMAIAQIADFNSEARQGWYEEEPLGTIIASRDKDLRMVPGWHYSWECGLQPEKAPYFVDDLGVFEPKYTPKVSKKTQEEYQAFKKLEATGLRLFYAQILMGDKTDNIPGLAGIGGKKAYDALVGCVSEMELYLVCLGMYEEKYAEDALEELTEQARLVWMVRELNEDGSPVMWEVPNS